MKKCSRCKKLKRKNNFNKRLQMSDGLASHCKICARDFHLAWANKNREKTREQAREWYRNNKESSKWRRIKSLYGITKEEYLAKLKQQKNRCAICKRHEKNFEKWLDVDHNHINKKVRGLLCGDCNKAIGLLEENKDRCKSTVKYLNKWEI